MIYTFNFKKVVEVIGDRRGHFKIERDHGHTARQDPEASECLKWFCRLKQLNISTLTFVYLTSNNDEKKQLFQLFLDLEITNWLSPLAPTLTSF